VVPDILKLQTRHSQPLSLSLSGSILAAICTHQAMEERISNRVTMMFHNTEVVLWLILGFIIIGEAGVIGFSAGVGALAISILYLLIRFNR